MQFEHIEIFYRYLLLFKIVGAEFPAYYLSFPGSNKIDPE